MDVLRVGAPVATVWASPDAPRDLDAAAVADHPDLAAWLDGLSAEDRLGLHGRTLTQLVAGEPAQAVDVDGDWVRVAAPWQPNPGDEAGYLGWVRRAHLRPTGEKRSVYGPKKDGDVYPAKAKVHGGKIPIL